MSRYFATEGVPPEGTVEYYRKRARGGAGLIITEGVAIPHPVAALKPGVPHFYGNALPVWKDVVDAVHGEGSLIMAQLWHAGLLRLTIPGQEQSPAMGPSATMPDVAASGQQMSEADIADTIDAYVQAAIDAERLGFDGVNIHGGHGYLLDGFMWSQANGRTDGYGGDHAGRTRFASEVIRAVRCATKPGFLIMFRFSQWKTTNYTARLAETPEDLAMHLQPLAEAGVDIFDASTRRFWLPEFPNSSLNLAGWAKKLTGKPAMSVGSVTLEGPRRDQVGGAELVSSVKATNLEDAARAVERGDFDIMAVGRAMIANPDWAEKVQSGAVEALVPFNPQMLHSLN